MLELNELLELEEVQLVPNTIKRETANFYAGIIGEFTQSMSLIEQKIKKLFLKSSPSMFDIRHLFSSLSRMAVEF